MQTTIQKSPITFSATGNSMTSDIFINKKIWKQFSKEELIEYVQKVFYHYRENGFPYVPDNKKFRQSEFKKLSLYDLDRVITDNIIKQTMHGLSLCWSYMPHSFSVKCNGFMSPMEAFNDDIQLIEAIVKRIHLGDNMSDNGIKKMLKMMTGVQSVSNFRPTAAGAIYRKYAKDKVVWDMSSGYGGRLLGAIIAPVHTYIGTEPDTRTMTGLKQMAHDFAKCNVKLHKVGSEDFIPNKESLDFCFTSPPYFDNEQYSTEPSQSYIKYPTIDEWSDGFLEQTLSNAYFGLKQDGLCMINIANTRKHNLEEICLRKARNVGFKHIDTLKLMLSSFSKTKKFKYEPIFVFKK